MSPRTYVRRRFLTLLGSALGALALPRRALPQVDQGIGGTGAAPGPIDHGIGGTGVIGTIRRFGSIVVNDLRIAYPKEVTVTLDGEPATATALKVGQVVRVVARREHGVLTTKSIAVTSEVVGKIERIQPKTMTVSGQTVSTADLTGAGIAGAGTFKVGDHIGVGGLRRLDGVIVASVLEKRPDTIVRVAGPVVRSADGKLTIGGLQVEGVPAALVGKRALLEGRLDGQVFAATRSRSERELLGGDITRLSVEAYVERSASGLRLGSGLNVSGSSGTISKAGAVRAVITTQVGRGGELRVQSLRLDSAPARKLHREEPRKAPHKASPNKDLGAPMRGNLNDLNANRISGQRPNADTRGPGGPGRGGDRSGHGNPLGGGGGGGGRPGRR